MFVHAGPFMRVEVGECAQDVSSLIGWVGGAVCGGCSDSAMRRRWRSLQRAEVAPSRAVAQRSGRPVEQSHDTQASLGRGVNPAISNRQPTIRRLSCCSWAASRHPPSSSALPLSTVDPGRQCFARRGWFLLGELAVCGRLAYPGLESFPKSVVAPLTRRPPRGSAKLDDFQSQFVQRRRMMKVKTQMCTCGGDSIRGRSSDETVRLGSSTER
jgi:hypothetical protein